MASALPKINIYRFNRFVDEGHTSWYLTQIPHSHRNNIPLDIQKSSSWLLFHQALFHTFVHHDADGYATWTQVLEGLKIWVLLRPQGFGTTKSRKALWDSFADFLNDAPDENGFYGKECERAIVYASPGDIMCVYMFLKKSLRLSNFFNFSFQYPGCLHEVYTPIPSVVRGGHFYSYTSLHLTEVSRSIDKLTEESLSNQTHPCASLTLAMMLLALPLFNDISNIPFFFHHFHL